MDAYYGWDKVTELVSGGAKGVDSVAIALAKERGMQCAIFIPGWKQHGKPAGGVRNNKMAFYSDALLAVWDGKSRGTKHMIEAMTDLKKPVEVVMQS